MRLLVLISLGLSIATSGFAKEVQLGHRRFTIPDGYEIRSVASTELTQRPIVADFDHEGHLYVAESSGSNDEVETQLKEKPHSILRLSDLDRDGVFDKRTVFADEMMFPEGALWYDGSLYVSAPPSIWKLTDTDGDGVADQREEWFDGKTLTGCANDLHGPYLGPDGWIYWCKGAFAEQTYEQPNREPLVTRAAHIFRRRPSGGPIEPVMTGGMDNPVELVFTPGGERIFTTTFFQHPANGQRDGLVHAIYGGVYGKDHGVLEGHLRTGPLMPVMTHLGAAAPSGLVRLESDSLGFRGQLLTACFNLHSVTRHQLVPDGSTFRTEDYEIVTCDDLDFHPTDVLEDADGSLLIVDTGGWYKLCCPTSQLHKPDVLGAIYRLRREDAASVNDPRGSGLVWKEATAADMAQRLKDPRPAVRRRARSELRTIGVAAIPHLEELLKHETRADARLEAVWSLCRIDAPEARAALRSALTDPDNVVRQAAAHAASVWRDGGALAGLKQLLTDDDAANRRAAAEALGRIGGREAASDLLLALQRKCDRVLSHSLIYALIESSAAPDLRSALAATDARVVCAALWVLDQSSSRALTSGDLCVALDHPDSEVRLVATTLAAGHPEWGSSIAEVLRRQSSQTSGPDQNGEFADRLSALAAIGAVRNLIEEVLRSDSANTELQLAVLLRLENKSFQSDSWNATLGNLLVSQNTQLVSATVRFLTPRTKAQQSSAHLHECLTAISRSDDFEAEVRLLALQDFRKVDDQQFSLLVSCLQPTQSAVVRGLAATALAKIQLTKSQLFELAEALPTVGPLELSRVLSVFEKQGDGHQLGLRLVTAMEKCPAAETLSPQRVVALVTKLGARTSEPAQALFKRVAVDPESQPKRIDDLLEHLPSGDVRRGQRIFHSEKAACFVCHAVGYRGGTIGPDLTRIARIRSRRDLLEALVFPSASFVRSYEPVILTTHDGEVISGVIKDQNSQQVVLQLDATEQRRIDSADIEEVLPGKVSIMPTGLDKQLTSQQLADLMSFLESRK